MSEDSKIEWTKHTFNPWSGCTKLSEGCANCYAAALPPSMRRGAEWGDRPRVVASDSYWRQPLAWNRAAEKAGERHRVFCASVADVFEDRADLDEHRDRLFTLIDQTPTLDWLLLTKRPQVAVRYAQQIEARSNIWLGASVEDQRAADERIPWLLQVPARVRFLSMEPLLGVVYWNRFTRHLPLINMAETLYQCGFCGCAVSKSVIDRNVICPRNRIDWVIVGGESGHRARPMHPDWARSIRDQCKAAGVPFFFKQWGEWAPDWYRDDDAPPGTPWKQADESMSKVGKAAAGRLLDGREHNALPTPS